MSKLIAFLLLVSTPAYAGGYPVYQKLRQHTFDVEFGTAFSVRYKNHTYLVSNWHVCRGHETLSAKNDIRHETRQATVLVSVPEKDLCVLTPVEETGLSIGRSVLKGYPIYTAGYPQTSNGALRLSRGVTLDFKNSLLNFNLDEEDCPASFTHRTEQKEDGTTEFVCEKQFRVRDTTAYGWFGSSGSPMVNSKGEVVGVVNQKNDETASFLPISSLLEILKSLESKRP